MDDAANLAAAALGILWDALDSDDGAEVGSATTCDLSMRDRSQIKAILDLIGFTAVQMETITQSMRAISKDMRKQLGVKSRGKHERRLRAAAERLVPRLYKHNEMLLYKCGQRFRRFNAVIQHRRRLRRSLGAVIF